MMKNVAIVGGGFYGLMLSIFLSKKYNVTVFEEQSDVMMKASSLCQMRIHTGMMYPNSLKTAISCLKTFKPFMLRFKDAIVDDFTSLYAIATDSKISCDKFRDVQRSLGQHMKRVKNEIFDARRISEVFECEEFTFDPLMIKQILLNECSDNNVKIELNRKITNIAELEQYDKIFLCNYSDINNVLVNSGGDPIESLRVISSEKIFCKDNLGDIAVCVVDGDYFNTMCLPKRYDGLKTLTGANLTNGIVSKNGEYVSAYEKVFDRVKNYIPDIKLNYVHSQFGEKTIVDTVDRTCFIRKENFNKDVYSIIGGKITNVFVMFDELKKLIQ